MKPILTNNENTIHTEWRGRTKKEPNPINSIINMTTNTMMGKKETIHIERETRKGTERKARITIQLLHLYQEHQTPLFLPTLSLSLTPLPTPPHHNLSLCLLFALSSTLFGFYDSPFYFHSY